MNKIDKLKEIIVCPKCGGDFDYQDSGYACPQCAISHTLKDSRFSLYEVQGYQGEDNDSFIFKLKSLFKKFPLFYKFLCHTAGAPVTGISPKRFLKNQSRDKVIINVGSGPKIIRHDVINADVFPYPHTSLVIDACNMPIKDNSVDIIICESLIEHLPNPEKLISEINRVLKPGGQVFLAVPFMLGFHSSPNDFYRWTDQGLLKLFSEFSDVKVAAMYGPTASLAFLFGEWLAILLSFNIRPLYNFWIFIAFIIQVLLTPLKLLDYLLTRYSFSRNIAFGFSVIASKK